MRRVCTIRDIQNTTNMKDTLFIVGNGFDIAHGIPSKYSDFRNWMIKDEELFDVVCDTSLYLESDDTWGQLEKAFGKFDTLKIFDDLDRYIKVFREDLKAGGENVKRFVDYIVDITLRPARSIYFDMPAKFTEWMQKVGSDIYRCGGPIQQLKEMISNRKNLSYFSFNYTNTLEELYEVPPDNVFHIHRTNDRDVIFGHEACNITDDEVRKKINEMKKKYTNENDVVDNICSKVLDALKKKNSISTKDVQQLIAQNEERFSQYSSVGVIVVLGHSLADVDMPYFAKIRQVIDVDSVVWYFSIHGSQQKTQKKNIREFLKKLQGICENKVIKDEWQCFEMPQLRDNVPN